MNQASSPHGQNPPIPAHHRSSPSPTRSSRQSNQVTHNGYNYSSSSTPNRSRQSNQVNPNGYSHRPSRSPTRSSRQSNQATQNAYSYRSSPSPTRGSPRSRTYSFRSTSLPRIPEVHQPGRGLEIDHHYFGTSQPRTPPSPTSIPTLTTLARAKAASPDRSRSKDRNDLATSSDEDYDGAIRKAKADERACGAWKPWKMLWKWLK